MSHFEHKTFKKRTKIRKNSIKKADLTKKCSALEFNLTTRRQKYIFLYLFDLIAFLSRSWIYFTLFYLTPWRFFSFALSEILFAFNLTTLCISYKCSYHVQPKRGIFVKSLSYFSQKFMDLATNLSIKISHGRMKAKSGE